jgi:excisionase family DNA binding protein
VKQTDFDGVRAGLKQLDSITARHPEVMGIPGSTSPDEWIKTLEGTMRDIYTIQEAAEYFKVHPQTLRRAIAAGRLKAAKFGKDYRITKDDLIAFYRYSGGDKIDTKGVDDDSEDRPFTGSLQLSNRR